MDTFSGGALIVLALVVLSNWRNGSLTDWLNAKFLNKTAGGGQDWSPGHWSPGIGSALGTSMPVATNAAHAGFLAAPVPGATVTGTFGEARPSHTHTGIDYAAPMGTPIDAAAGGRVIAAGPAGGYGNRVIVDHGNGITTLYAHLSNIGVKIGDTLRQGQVLGKVGMTGDATGPHLHFEVRNGGVPVNPLDWLANTLNGLLA